jgi:PAS domain S-box-containing protein
MNPLRTIIVEDDENDLLLITAALEEHGFDVQSVCVKDAAGLRLALAEQAWDVVISDYRLPSFNGREALGIVRATHTDVAFILVTAALGDELAVAMIRDGADDYVLKGGLARLGHCVERAVREYRHRRERTLAHEALASAQRRFQQTFEHAPLGIVHIDTGRRIISANDHYCRMLGYSHEELEQFTFDDFTHPEDRETGRRGFQELHAGVRPVHRCEKRYVRKDGSVIWVDLIATVVRTADGEVDYTLGITQEITAHKLVQEKVHRQGLLLDAVEQAVIATDIEGNITYWNRFAGALYGWNEAEVLGRHILDVTDPTISSALGSSILNRLIRGESWSGEAIVTRRDGTTMPVMVIQSPIVNADGSLSGMVGVSFDLSERKAAEAALRQSEERYRSVIEGVVEIIISVSLDGTITSVNRAFVVATGWTPEAIVGRPLWDLLPAGEEEEARNRLRLRLDGGETPEVTGHLLRKDGSEIIIDGVACVARDRDGVPEVFYFIRDVTDRKRAEEERERLDRQLRLVLESTDEGIYAVDAAGTCTLLNRAGAQILGFRPEELIGRTIHDVIHATRPDGTPYPKEECAVYLALRLGTTVRVRDELYWRRDGTPVPVEYASAPVIENGAIIGAVTTFTDVSQQRMLESQLEKANRLNGLGRVAATIAHEFNNVLMGIQPFVDIIRLDAAERPRTRDAIERIATSVRRGKRVTSEILQFTRQSEPHLKPVDLTAWLNDLAAEAREVLGQNILFTIDIESGLRIAADASALHQVFMNLIMNARDAVGARGTISVKARRSEGSRFPFGFVERGENFAHFSVTDNGAGMSAATMQHVFEPLFTTKKSGTGLGLALAHHVVRQHEGHIFVESREGEGTTFHVFVPLTAEAVEVREKQPRVPLRNLQSVVLVEDDATVAAGFVALLGLDNIHVQVATTGRDAIPTIERVAPDAVVLDVGLPDMDGTAVYEAIARRWPSLPVIFATGHFDASRLSAYTVKPNVGHIMKPYELSALYESLADLTPLASHG